MGSQYIVGGASRSGKSILARRLQEKFKISWILGDGIVSSMEGAFPDLGISHRGALQDIGDRFADFIKFLLWHYGYAGCGYVLDTTHLYPRHIITMREKIGNVAAIFLGYTQADPGEKFRQIRRFDPKNWWTSELSVPAMSLIPPIATAKGCFERSKDITAKDHKANVWDARP
jgi:hypothetical protein